jgi:glycosyltransferase involved in cell wall biosynthesis
MKKLSIITINYNQAESLKLTLESVRTSGAAPDSYELIVIDGGSTDGSPALLNEYSDIISLGISEPDEGIFSAMNKGLKFASGQYVIFMNSGDSFCSNILSGNLVEQFDADIIYGDLYLKTGALITYLKQTEQLDFAYLIGKTICHQSMFLRTSLCKKYIFETNYRLMGDWIQLFQIMKYEKPTVCKLDMAVCIYDGNWQSEIYKDVMAKERMAFLNTIYSSWELETLLKISRMRGRNWYSWVLSAVDKYRRHYILNIISKCIR